MPRVEIGRFAVVVPARDEETLIGAALDAVAVAAAGVDLPVDVVVIADACTDRTAEVARDRGAQVITREEANVGAARAAGASWAMQTGVDGLWLACTDADSEVPADWLVTHQQHAASGVDVLLGRIRLPDFEHERHHGWITTYASARDHVHGANLGVRASSYAAVGGFRPLSAHEDVDLVQRLRRGGAQVAWTEASPVTTSARTVARAPAGVGTDLAGAGA